MVGLPAVRAARAAMRRRSATASQISWSEKFCSLPAWLCRYWASRTRRFQQHVPSVLAPEYETGMNVRCVWYRISSVGQRPPVPRLVALFGKRLFDLGELNPPAAVDGSSARPPTKSRLKTQPLRRVRPWRASASRGRRPPPGRETGHVRFRNAASGRIDRCRTIQPDTVLATVQPVDGVHQRASLHKAQDRLEIVASPDDHRFWRRTCGLDLEPRCTGTATGPLLRSLKRESRWNGRRRTSPVRSLDPASGPAFGRAIWLLDPGFLRLEQPVGFGPAGTRRAPEHFCAQMDRRFRAVAVVDVSHRPAAAERIDPPLGTPDSAAKIAATPGATCPSASGGDPASGRRSAGSRACLRSTGPGEPPHPTGGQRFAASQHKPLPLAVSCAGTLSHWSVGHPTYFWLRPYAAFGFGFLGCIARCVRHGNLVTLVILAARRAPPYTSRQRSEGRDG